MIRETQSKFQEISLLLNPAGSHSIDSYDSLSEATQEAYIAMNEGMCESDTVCHECAKHRDFLQTMLPILEDLKNDASLAETYSQKLHDYRLMVQEVLSRISSILSSL